MDVTADTGFDIVHHPREQWLFGKDNNHFYSLFDSVNLFESFLNLPVPQEAQENPLDFAWIKHSQEQDQVLKQLQLGLPQSYHVRQFDGIELVCWATSGMDPETQWKICLTQETLLPTIRWFHQILNHPGQEQLFHSIYSCFYHPQLRHAINSFICDACQKYKLSGTGYGHLPPRDVNLTPWFEVAVDLIGPWTIIIGNDKYDFNALTSIDTTTNLTEMIQVTEKTSMHVRNKFEQSWLSRYPRPIRCVHDNGREFTGFEFQQLLQILQIKDVATTSCNPQSNAICEQMHQTVGNVLRTLLYANPPHNLQEANDLVDSALATAIHALQTNVSSALGTSPGALAFARDMFLNVPLTADWIAIHEHREQLVNENLRHQNNKRHSHDYVQGQKVLKFIYNPTKLGRQTEGPYVIQQVHVNGMVSIQICEGVRERINIRRVKPYNEPT